MDFLQRSHADRLELQGADGPYPSAGARGRREVRNAAGQRRAPDDDGVANYFRVVLDGVDDEVYLAVFDHVERLDETSESGRLFLKFEPAEEEQAPEDTTVLATR